MRIDIVHSAIMGHKTVWEERQYLLKLAIIPLLMKIICSVAIYTMDMDSVTLRHVLVMLPAYFFEGWMIAQFLRTLLTGERWPMRVANEPTKQQMEFILWRARGILAGILCFVLIVMIQGGLAVLMDSIRQMVAVDPAQSQGGGSIMFLLLGVVMMVATIWMFRLVWLYIPLVILTPIKPFLNDIKGMMTSVYMIGLWILSVVPLMFVTMLLSGLLLGGSPETAIENATIQGFLTIILHVIGQFIVQIISITAMAHALKDVLVKYGAKPIFIEPEKPY